MRLRTLIHSANGVRIKKCQGSIASDIVSYIAKRDNKSACKPLLSYQMPRLPASDQKRYGNHSLGLSFS